MNLTGAEVLKLVRRRGLMIWVAVLTLGSVLVPYAVLVALHAAAPERHGPAGGGENPLQVLGLLAMIGGVGGILIAATAGSQDHSSGVFRDLVVTGRPRTALFLARVRGALAVYLPLVAVAFALAVAASFAFAGGEPSLLRGHVPGYAAWVAATAVLNVVLGVSLATIVSSRISIAVLIAWNTAVAPLLLQLRDLGGIRAAVGSSAAQHFVPAGPATVQVAMSTATALLVLALWTAIPLVLAARATTRRDA